MTPTNGAGNGIVVGVVFDLDDPESLARVRVRYPHLDDAESEWCRLATPMAGGRRGAFFRPEVQDEVLVAFEHGDPRRPHIVGALWSQVDEPPPDDGDAVANNWRFIRSRSGHVILLDDTDGAEKIELVDKDEKRRVTIDSANNKIVVSADEGDVDVAAPLGKVTIDATEVEINATGEIKVQATGKLTLRGSEVAIN